MACELPSVGGAALVGVGMWDSPWPQEGPKSHPFDRPFNVMKALQGELNELRATSQQESRRRETEVARLQTEVSELQRGLAEERARRTTNVDGVERSLGVELAQVQKALHEARLEASAALKEQRKITVGDLDAVRAQLAALHAALDSEHRERLADVKELSHCLGANAASQDNLAMKLTRDLDDHIRFITELQAQDKKRAEDLAELRVQAAEHAKAITDVRVEQAAPIEEFPILSSRVEAIEKSIEDFRASTASAIREHWKTTTADVSELRARIVRQGAALAEDLERERRERSEAVKELTPQVKANEETSKRALVRFEHLTSGHMGNPLSKHCAVCLEDRGAGAARLAPRPPPQPRERRPAPGGTAREFFP